MVLSYYVLYSCYSESPIRHIENNVQYSEGIPTLSNYAHSSDYANKPSRIQSNKIYRVFLIYHSRLGSNMQWSADMSHEPATINIGRQISHLPI